MKIAIYARVSTRDKDQNPQLQTDRLIEYANQQKWDFMLDNIYVDHASGGDKSRPALDMMMKDARCHRFQAVLVTKIDRIARSLVNLVNMMQELDHLGINFICLDQPIDLKSPQGKFMLGILGAAAEYERDMIRERVREGMQKAIRDGKKVGRPKHNINPEVVKSMKIEEATITWIAQQMQTSRQTVNRILKADTSV